MTNEEMERAIQFLIENQAHLSAEQMKLTADMQRLTADMQRLTSEMQALTEHVRKLTEHVELIAQATLANTGQIGQLAEAQTRTERRLQELAQSHADLAERLNIFITVVEKYISEHGNREKGPES